MLRKLLTSFGQRITGIRMLSSMNNNESKKRSLLKYSSFVVGGAAAGAVGYQLWKTPWNKSREEHEEGKKRIDNTRLWIDFVQRLDPDPIPPGPEYPDADSFSIHEHTDLPFRPYYDAEEDEYELLDIELNPLDEPTRPTPDTQPPDTPPPDSPPPDTSPPDTPPSDNPPPDTPPPDTPPPDTLPH